jgi:hypothetical protein
MRASISRHVLRDGVLVLALGLVSVALLVLAWQQARAGGYVLNVGSPEASISHFYGVESAEGVGFRWSRSLSAVSLPALGSSQVVTVTVNPARPPRSPAVHFRLLVDGAVVGEYVAVPGWNSYTATVGTRLSPDVRLVIESDTFYPSPSDRRRLGLAIASIETAARPARVGFAVPPPLWLLGALLWPLLGYAGARAWRRGGAIIAACGGALVPLVLAALVPAQLALPLFGWLSGLAALLVVLLLARRWLEPEGYLARTAPRVMASRWELPAVGGLVAVLAVVMTWPVAARLGDSLPGWPGDNFAFLYKFWWFRTALLETHRWPFFDPNVFAPFGFSLGQGEPTLANTLPGVPLGALFGDVAAYNLVALFSFVVSGLGGYLLVREITGSKAAGVLSGVAFAFCPYRMSQFAGHIQLLGTGWLALAFYFAERAFRTGRWTMGATAGLSLALAALSAWYYAYIMGLLFVLYVALRLWTLRREIRWPLLGRAALAAMVVLVVLAGPVALPSLLLARGGALSHSAKAADEHSAAPSDYVIPNELHPLWGEPFMRAHAEQNVLESSLYLGIVCAGIALGGWLVARRGRDHERGFSSLRACWLVVGVVAFVLSLGLTLHDTGGQVSPPVTLPGRLLYDWLPLFSSMRAYARFGLLVALAVIVLMGMGWANIASRFPRRANWLALLALVALLADFWTRPYAWGTTRVIPTKASRYLVAAPPGAIAQMPLTSALTGPAMFAETWYGGKPIAYGYDTFEPIEWREARPALVRFPEDVALEVLRGWGVRYVVVSGNAYGADWPGTLDYLKSLPGLRYVDQFAEERTWDVDPGVLDARPDAEEFALPDTLAVFILLPSAR